MNCPKCGKELINVNGKYVCVDCGIEVPENEAGQTVLPEKPATVENQPIEMAPTPNVVTPTETTPVQKVPSEVSSGVVEETKIAEMVEEATPVPTEPMITTLDSSVPISEMKPMNSENVPPAMSSETEPVTSQANEGINIPITNLDNETATTPNVDSVEIPTETPVSPQEAPVNPGPNQASGLEAVSAVSPVATPEPVAIDPFDQVDKTETPAPQVPTPQQEPIQINPNTNPAPPIQPDPAIFQDPMYDSDSENRTQNADATALNQAPQMSTQAQEAQPKDDTRKLKIILLLGIVLAIILLVSGIAAYLLLT